MAKPILRLGFHFQITFFFIISSLISYPSLSCPDDHRESLLKFKSLLLETIRNSSTNTSSLVLDSWNSTSDCCWWEGVTCNSPSASRSVISLDLGGVVPLEVQWLMVSGRVLTPLFHIRSLTKLGISYNSIQGEIPANGFANLSKLVHLDMAGNKFNGSILSQLFRLRYLQYLDLSINLLVGQIPAEIGNLTQLRQLSLGNNGFIGEIPSEIGSLPNISTLDLSGNRLTGGIPPSIRNLGKLETLKLEDNLLSREIPPSLFDIKSLEELYLGGNNLTWNNSVRIIKPRCVLSGVSLRSCHVAGPIPSWLSTQTSLQLMDLSENELTGSFPQWLAEMDVQYIILSGNKLTGTLPPRLFNSLSLSVLELSRNNFHGEIPETIGEANGLMILSLASNNFSGQVPKSISNIYRITSLDLSGNRFSEKFPTFSPDAFIFEIDVSSNEFSGEIPVTFGQYTRKLLLGQNKFFGSLPLNLTNLKQLTELDLHDNNISGEVPSFISEIPSLQVLNLRNNSLQGTIPSELSLLDRLRILDLSSNKLTGRIPPKLGNLTGMIQAPKSMSFFSSDFDEGNFSCKIDQFHELMVNWKKSKRGLSRRNLRIYSLLDLSRNQLTGEIPASMGSLKGLKSLNISYNKLSGKIPTSFGKLQRVESLDLSHNKLSGVIPRSFTNLQMLTTLDLSNNELVGAIPVGGQMDTMDDRNAYANNSGLCGVQIQVPCPKALPPSESPQVNEINERETWFSWVGAGIGFPVGLSSTMAVVYFTGFLRLKPQKQHRRQQHRRRLRRRQWEDTS